MKRRAFLLCDASDNRSIGRCQILNCLITLCFAPQYDDWLEALEALGDQAAALDDRDTMGIVCKLQKFFPTNYEVRAMGTEALKELQQLQAAVDALMPRHAEAAERQARDAADALLCEDAREKAAVRARRQAQNSRRQILT